MVDTSRFGPVEVDEERLITLPLGLPGFADSHTFALIDHRPDSIFRWLQSLDYPEVAFVVIDPLMFAPDYPLDMVRRATTFLKLDPDEAIVAFVICTVPPAPAEPTANFLAPIGVGTRSRRGAQVVLHDSGYESSRKFLSTKK